MLALPSANERQRTVYHLVHSQLWDQAKAAAKPYAPPSFKKDGFIQCSDDAQVLVQFARRCHAKVRGEFLILEIDTSHPGIEEGVQYARPSMESVQSVQAADPAMLQPRIYAPLPLDAVVAVAPVSRAAPSPPAGPPPAPAGAACCGLFGAAAAPAEPLPLVSAHSRASFVRTSFSSNPEKAAARTASRAAAAAATAAALAALAAAAPVSCGAAAPAHGTTSLLPPTNSARVVGTQSMSRSMSGARGGRAASTADDDGYATPRTSEYASMNERPSDCVLSEAGESETEHFTSFTDHPLPAKSSVFLY
jgi:uncharacterized protein (DUF952 family)